MKKLILFFCLTLTLLVQSRAGDPGHHLSKETKKADPIEKFWAWFTANEKRLQKFEEDPDKYLSELLVQAKKIQDGLAIELEPPKSGIINMTISADGDRDLFDLVKKIVAQSPKLPGWNFLAFRQRMSPDLFSSLQLKLGDVELDPLAMKFFPVISGDSLDLIIYANGITDENFERVAYGGLLLLDNILGEYDCVTKVRAYDFHTMPSDKKELQELRPLLELAAFVDAFHEKKK